MHIISYDIHDFKYDKESKTFNASLDNLYPNNSNYHFPFPNGKRHFYISNSKTRNFRRFTFKESIKIGISEIWEYVSEDDYKAHIKVN